MSEEPRRSIFREQALDRLSSPDRVDELIRVLSPRDWLPLAALGVIVLAMLGWSMCGSIDVRVAGQGVLMKPSRVVNVQARMEGRVKSIEVKVGQRVEKGEPLAILDRPELRERIQLLRRQLVDEKERADTGTELVTTRTELERSAISRQKGEVDELLHTREKLAKALGRASLKGIRRQKKIVSKQLSQARDILERSEKELDSARKLRKSGFASEAEVLRAEQAHLDAMMTLGRIESQLAELKIQKVQAELAVADQSKTNDELRRAIEELEVREAALDADDFQSKRTAEERIEQLEREIAEAQAQLDAGRIESEQAGRVLATSVTLGDVVAPGSPVVTMEIEDEESPLVGLLFLEIGAAKRVRDEMQVQVSPHHVERERYGSMKATVTRVSQYPMSISDATALIGSKELAASITAGGRQVLVEVALERDAETASGYAWTSSTGPDLAITAGTAVDGRIAVESRAPISYVLPFLRELTGAE